MKFFLFKPLEFVEYFFEKYDPCGIPHVGSYFNAKQRKKYGTVLNSTSGTGTNGTGTISTSTSGTWQLLLLRRRFTFVGAACIYIYNITQGWIFSSGVLFISTLEWIVDYTIANRDIRLISYDLYDRTAVLYDVYMHIFKYIRSYMYTIV